MPVARVLVARAAEGRDVLIDALRERGARRRRRRALRDRRRAARRRDPRGRGAAADYVLFTSGSSVRFFAAAGGALAARGWLDRPGDQRGAACARRRARPRGRPAHPDGLVAALLADAVSSVA